MTTQIPNPEYTIPQSPFVPPAPPADTVKAPKRKRTVPLFVAVLAGSGLALASCLTGVAMGGGGSPKAAPAPAASAATAATAAKEVAPPPPAVAKPADYVPTPQDFKLEVKTTQKHCFGSAGCNVTFHVDVSYVGARPPGAGKTYEVVYKVDGGKEPMVDSFSLTGSEVTQDDNSITTSSSSAVLTATATDVNKL